ncbi:YciI family protein [Phenylobacterium sp.]|uniref:YciI family protein n=1 Tax=Phenylobacterium sp. TaxID=1871053 RepID=UPI003982DF21
MRVLVLVKPYEAAPGAMPNAEDVAVMGKFNDELIAAGVMVDGAGLHPIAKGARLSFSANRPTVLDGPFAETKEVIGGYWIWKVDSLQDAIDWARRAPMGEADLELRPFMEPEDFEGIATREMIDEEKRWREDQLAKAPKAG